MHDGLKNIPQELFTEESLNYKNTEGETVWHVAAEYINKVLQERLNYNIFIAKHPELERDIEFRDTRLVVKEAIEDRLIFKFNEIAADVILNKEGAFLNNNNYKTIANVVTFIEDKYENKELKLPNNTLKVEQFVL